MEVENHISLQKSISMINSDQNIAKDYLPEMEKELYFKGLVFYIFGHNKDLLMEHIISKKPEYLSLINSLGETPLFVAVSSLSVLVQKIVDKVGVNTKTTEGNNILHYVCKYPVPRRLLVITSLIKTNAFLLEDKNNVGETPLHVAARSGDLELVLLLMKYGANKSVESLNGLTPASCALESGNSDIYEILNDRDDIAIEVGEVSPTLKDGGKKLTLKERYEEAKKRTIEQKLSIEKKLEEWRYHRTTESTKEKKEKKNTSLQAIFQQIDEVTMNKEMNDLLQEKPYDPSKMYHVFSVDGGGIKGVLESIIIARILAQNKDFLKSIDLLCGCSVGSILVSFLAVGYAPETCADLLQIISENVFVRSKINVTECKYKTSVLKAILEYTLGETKIKDIKRHFLVDSFRIDSTSENRECEAVCFTNLQKGYEEERLSDICLRSSAAPTYFEPYQMYVDGGMLNNTPVGLSWGYLFGINGLNLDPKRVSCFSLSAGKPDPYYIDSTKIGKGGVMQWAVKISDTFFYSIRSWTVKEGDLYLGDRWLRFDPPLGCVIDLDDIEKMPKIREIAETVDITVVNEWVQKHWLN
ncbi:hypothetical protein EIN_424870 [Entamoeba invadens IP1]|uniref:phospholipase A2 n=1 Tax=Entamoeba invadens IP1 TaxID=370355 RepID=A0A0A1U613_ENTIV|nr:hypothetical protein EIN_424870 [Entamoeba invadens IP1]ELP89765.1 hypothetical protein EIN_424870 [Entamoeba invadens IP1]|eukprot:XP_004256536.1 hypothetical protein EIN_424870 [Entamoeba invadens IP1]